MRCLVTGAAGFIGSHLCELLVARGHTVVGFDNLSTGQRANLVSLHENDRFKFLRGDVAGSNTLEKHFPFDWVFHLAGKADLIPSITNPGLYHETNVNGTFTLLQLCKLFPVKRFVYAASSTCYGKNPRTPTDEDEPMAPEHPYAITKKIGEDYVLHWGKIYKIPVVSLRLFNVYGPRARTSGDYGAMFGVFLAQLANHRPLTVVGDGKQKRDFTHVTDVARAFLMAADSGLSGHALNIGSGKPRSVNEIVALLKPKNGVEYLPRRPGEPEITHADRTKALNIGWKPKISIEEGVMELKNMLEEWKSAPLWDKISISRATKSWFEALS